MDATLRSLVAIARDGDMQRRSAAILMLTELGCAEPAAVQAVTSALESPNAVLRDFALDYAAKTKAPPLLPLVVPLLADPDSAVREKADRILTEAGRAGIEAAATLLPRLAPRERSQAAAWVAHQQGRKPLDALVRLLGSADPEAVRQSAHALAGACASATDEWRSAVAERLVPLLGHEAMRADEGTYLALLDLAAVLARPELRAALSQAIETTAGRVRTAAARAFAAAVHRVKLGAAEFRMLVGLLEDPDEAVVRSAAELLGDQPFKVEHFAILSRLASGPSVAARKFALAKMAELDASAVLKTLLAHLDDADYTGRTTAQAALKQVEGVHSPLVKELLRCDDERRAWVLADIIAARGDAWKREQVSALVTRLDDALDRNDRLFSALLHVAGQVATERVGALLEERAEKLIKQKKYDLAAKRLSLRLELPDPSDEIRFLLALSRLRASRRDRGLPGRRRDEALEIFTALDRGTFPLVERLRKQRLTPEEMFYVGFHLAEEPAARDSAQALLRHVVKQNTRTKTGRAAKNKLELLERAVH